MCSAITACYITCLCDEYIVQSWLAQQLQSAVVHLLYVILKVYILVARLVVIMHLLMCIKHPSGSVSMKEWKLV